VKLNSCDPIQIERAEVCEGFKNPRKVANVVEKPDVRNEYHDAFAAEDGDYEGDEEWDVLGDGTIEEVSPRVPSHHLRTEDPYK
jgi:hypothetical protein